MTKEELRDYVEEQRNLDIIPYHVYSTLIDGIDTLEQESCDHAISCDIAVANVQELAKLHPNDANNLDRIIKCLETLPLVQPKSKIGHWIFDEILDRNYYCSECKSMGVDYWDYCPYCGARMEKEKL